ncbi:unnamed protein product [Rhizophagus irregularis]|uniref:Uncharacterized protein n=1 Tax=Rhizophagus irregularis TaxID=588596 RepID=A0A2I1G3I1_9GLOM|nr:hypothetical protein RhiirA4_454718 [Rhizophagus irregularis]CAB4421402.1 unnamed protein product [Rhizophagus irregularis]
MSNIEDSVGTTFEEDFLKFISDNGDLFLQDIAIQLGQFVENGFLKKLFDKGSQTMDKAALLVSMFGESWDNFTTCAYSQYGDMGDSESECPFANDDYPSTSLLTLKITLKPVRDTVDKQVKNQSITANPVVNTSVKTPQFLGAKFTTPEVTHILTGYKEVDDEQEQVRDIIVYDIPYTWDVEKILGELTLWAKL